MKDKPGRTEHSLVLFPISLPLASIPCPCFPSLALLSIPQLGILWMPRIPSWLPEGCSNPRISWNLSPCPCLVPRLCIPGLQRRGAAGQGRAGEKGGVPQISQLHPSPSRASGFVQLAEQSRDPSESEIIEGKTRGLSGIGRRRGGFGAGPMG